MAEAINPPLRDSSIGNLHPSIAWGRALVAGLVATIVITISMMLFGMNIMKSLGTMILGAGADATTQYIVGGLVHLMIGVGYGLVYAAVFGPVRRWGSLLKGAVFGLAITALALAAMPVMASMMGGGGAANPCNPCAAKSAAANPCNPCAAKKANPCNPCGAKSAAANPCNPCATKKAQNPCATNPCNPCGGGGSPYAGLISLVNHLIYGITLALVYGRGGAAPA